MKSYYSAKKPVYISMVDVNSRLRYDAILNIFQDIATAHATLMGMGYMDLKNSSNAFWVLSKIRFSLVGDIYQTQTALAKTWPIEPSAIRFMRDFTIKSPTGEVKGTSEWCLLDFDTMGLRKLSSVNYPKDLAHIKKRSNAGEFNRIREEVSEQNFCYEYTARNIDIDCNNHVNNVTYAKMALNCFSPQEFSDNNFRGFEIQFAKQTFFGDKIRLYKKPIEKGVYIEGKIADQTIFKCIFEK